MLHSPDTAACKYMHMRSALAVTRSRIVDDDVVLIDVREAHFVKDIVLGFHLLLRNLFFFSSRRRHTRLQGDWSSDVCSSDLRSACRTPLPAPTSMRRCCRASRHETTSRAWRGRRRSPCAAEARRCLCWQQTPEIGRASCRERV